MLLWGKQTNPSLLSWEGLGHGSSPSEKATEKGAAMHHLVLGRHSNYISNVAL